MKTGRLGLRSTIGLAVFALVGTHAAWAQTDAIPSQTLTAPADQYLEAVELGRRLARTIIAEDSLPGISIAVGLDGEIVWAEGFGWADKADSVPITPLTRFPTGSSVKPVTATAVGILVDQGRLDLDAPVQQYLPSYPQKRWPVTTRDLLGHIAGVRHYAGEHEVFTGEHCEDVGDGLARFAADTLLFRPRTQYQYSTFGYVLIGAVVQAAAGEPYLTFVQREILTPLGMDHTSPDEPVAGRATGYQPSTNRSTRLGIEPAPTRDQSCILPAGGFISTPSDLVRFGLSMLDNRLLEPATLGMLRTEQTLESGEPTEYGLGWFVHRVPFQQGGPPTLVVGHGGSSVGGSTAFMTLPEHGIVVSATSNVQTARRLSLLVRRVVVAFIGVDGN